MISLLSIFACSKFCFLVITPITITFSDICIDAIKTGLKGKTGNKGGVAISLNLYSTSLCFVCAHLAAGQTNVLDRNKHYELIRDKALFHNVRSCDMSGYNFTCHGLFWGLHILTCRGQSTSVGLGLLFIRSFVKITTIKCA